MSYFLLIGTSSFLRLSLVACKDIAKLIPKSSPHYFISGTMPDVDNVIRLLDKLIPE